MADISLIFPRELNPAATVSAGEAIPIDNGVTVQKATPTQIVNAGRPFATQAQAETGTDATVAMSPLTTKQAIEAVVPAVVTPFVELAEAWAESPTPPNPGVPESKSSKSWAEDAKAAAILAADNWTRTFQSLDDMLDDDVLTPVNTPPGTIVTVSGSGIYAAVSSGGAFETDGGVKLTPIPSAYGYSDRQFGVVADGVTDDEPAYALAASTIPNGSTLVVSGSGVRVIGNGVTFPQDDLTVACDEGAVFKQKSATPTIDTLIHFSGDNLNCSNISLDANLSGNPTATYTGRGELLKASGYRPRITNVFVNGTHVKDASCGIYVTGDGATVDGVTSVNTGRILIRGRADKATIRNVIARDIQDSLPGNGNRVIGWDGGSEETAAAFSWLLFEDIIGESSSDTFMSLIVVDDATKIGGRVQARNLLANFPNATGPDVIKFCNLERIDIDGLTCIHTTNTGDNTSLRFQHDDALPFSGVRYVNLSGVKLAGSVNFDGETNVSVQVSGDCEFNTTLSSQVCIHDVPNGNITVERGATFNNFTQAAISTSSNAGDAYISIAPAIYNGSPSGDPTSRAVVRYVSFLAANTPYRIKAGQVRVDFPIFAKNTRTQTDRRWILSADALNVGAMTDGVFYWSGTDAVEIGPRDADNWWRGAIAYAEAPIQGGISAFRCVSGGSSCQVAWSPSTAYSLGARAYNGGNVYRCVTSGTSASSGGPTGTGASITDGNCAWAYVSARATWTWDGQIGRQSVSAANIASASSGINSSGKFTGKEVWDSTNNRLMIARSGSATSPWDVCDGSSSVTPS